MKNILALSVVVCALGLFAVGCGGGAVEKPPVPADNTVAPATTADEHAGHDHATPEAPATEEAK